MPARNDAIMCQIAQASVSLDDYSNMEEERDAGHAKDEGYSDLLFWVAK